MQITAFADSSPSPWVADMAARDSATAAVVTEFVGRGDVLEELIAVIPTGRPGHPYPLRRGLVGRATPVLSSAGWEFTAEGVERVRGHGRTPTKARADWAERFHGRFQELIALRPFEMTPAEATEWSGLQDVVDVPLYLATKPITLRQVGTVKRARPLPDAVEWEGGRGERVDVRRMGDEFAGYKPGQRFEAVVERHPISFKLLRAVNVARLPALPPASGVAELWDRLPTSADYPAAELD